MSIHKIRSMMAEGPITTADIVDELKVSKRQAVVLMDILLKQQQATKVSQIMTGLCGKPAGIYTLTPRGRAAWKRQSTLLAV